MYDIPLPSKLTSKQKKELKTIEQRLTDFLEIKKAPQGAINAAYKTFEKAAISPSIAGTAVSYTHLCLVNQKRTYRDGAFDESEASDSRCIYDMLSILAQARSYDPADYKVGDKIKFPMATGRKVEEQTLIYRGKENVKAENGVTYRCLIFSLVEYDKKGKEKEVITFFVTDDLNHLPVRLDLFLNFGSAKAFLNNVTGNRHPLTSIVK